MNIVRENVEVVEPASTEMKTVTRTVQTESAKKVLTAHQQKLAKIARVIYFINGILMVLLAFRFFFRLASANPRSGFVAMIYGLTEPFVFSFQDIFSEPAVRGAVFEWSTLIAGVVFSLAFYGMVRLVYLLGEE